MKKTKVVFVALGLIGGTVLAQEQDCGQRPTGLKSLFGNATERYEDCLRRREEAQRKSIERLEQEGQEKLDRSEASCKNAVRGMSRQPSTLSFDRVPRYQLWRGLKLSGLNITEGGYSIELIGSDANGSFVVTCYMDKNYRVTNVR